MSLSGLCPIRCRLSQKWAYLIASILRVTVRIAIIKVAHGRSSTSTETYGAETECWESTSALPRKGTVQCLQV